MGTIGDQRPRVGIIGCGRIGSQMDEQAGTAAYPRTHAAAYVASKFELAALSDKIPGRLTAASQRWGITNSTVDLDEFLSLNLDVISICTSAEGRVELIERILERSSTRLLFCEKPVALSLRELQLIRELTDRAGARVLVNYIRRFDKEIQTLHARMAGGEFGAPRKAICQYGKGLLNNGSHVIDLLNMLFGTPSSARHISTMTDDRLETSDPTESAVFRYASKQGFESYLIATNHKDYSAIEWDLFFEKGRVRITDGGRRIEYFKVTDDVEFPGYNRLISVGHAEALRNTFAAANDELYELLHAKDRRPSSDLEESIKTIRIIEAIQKSKFQKGIEVSIEGAT